MPPPDSWSRRSFLAAAGAMPFTAPAVALLAQYKKVPVGLELYSVRGELMKDLMGTVRRVASLGYKVVEFYSPYASWTTNQAKEVRRLMDDLGIECRSTHNPAASLTTNLDRAIELNQVLGSKTIVQASAPARANTVDGWKAACATFTAATERLKPLGMTAGFHNHQTEWRPLEGGTERGMDILAAGTPKEFTLQFDAGTCVEAGADPATWIRSNAGRIRSVHCKDWGAGDKGGYRVAFGEGDVNWTALFEAAESVGGVEYYLVEQEIAGAMGEFAMVEKCMANWKQLRGGA